MSAAYLGGLKAGGEDALDVVVDLLDLILGDMALSKQPFHIPVVRALVVLDGLQGARAHRS